MTNAIFVSNHIEFYPIHPKYWKVVWDFDKSKTIYQWLLSFDMLLLLANCFYLIWLVSGWLLLKLNIRLYKFTCLVNWKLLSEKNWFVHVWFDQSDNDVFGGVASYVSKWTINSCREEYLFYVHLYSSFLASKSHFEQNSRFRKRHCFLH